MNKFFIKITATCCILAFAVTSMCACAKTQTTSSSVSSASAGTTAGEDSTAPKGSDISDFSKADISYRQPASESGTLNHVTYTTKNYSSDNSDTDTKAYVYLPYGYDNSGDKKYNILYLMHGAGGNEEGYLGTSDSPTELKYILDNMIQNKEIEPMIVVAPTTNQEGDAEDYYTGMNNFEKQLNNDLIPYIESNYRTYAQSTSTEDLINSRNHRAFGGFSMGGFVTMSVFLEDLDYFEYFIPMSAAYNYRYNELSYDDVAKIFADAAKDSGFTKNDYYIFAASGTDDFLSEPLYEQIKAMSDYTDQFAYTKNGFENGNMLFYQLDGNEHGSIYSYDYIYNALKLFFKN